MKRLLGIGVVASVLAGSVVCVGADATLLGRVRLTYRVLADGKPLAPGTYDVRLTGEAPSPVVGQSPDGERWVEFTRNGQVIGREVATVVARGEGAGVLKGPMPKPNQSRVDVLKGNEYVRVWINRAGVNYLINLRAAF